MICPACGYQMQERACHATCRRCGYLEDCSDGMLPVLVASARPVVAGRPPGPSQPAAKTPL